MATTESNPTNKLRFTDESDIEQQVKRRLKRKYGRGIYIDDYTTTSDEAIFIRLGNSTPSDVSDCREHDRVLKFIQYEPVHTLEAEPVGNGYVIDLPPRKEVYDGFVERKQKFARRLDQSMAHTIYQKLVSFPAVENQLGAIKEILRTVREYGPIKRETIHEIRGTTPKQREKTASYLRLLLDTEFIRSDEDEVIRSGPNLDVHDVQSVKTTDFSEVVLGQVINRAYSTLKDEMNITLLAHYPKYANSYYFTALQRDDPEVRLNAEAASQNLSTVYGENQHKIKVKQKLDDLADVGVLVKEDEFYQSNIGVYQDFSEQATVV